MSGICGIIIAEREGRLGPDSLERQCAALEIPRAAGKEPARYQRSLLPLLERAGLGASRSDACLSGTARGGPDGAPVGIAFHGRLYNREALGLPPGPNGERREEALRGLLALYLRDGAAFLDRLRGEYAVAVIDGRDGSALAAVDPFRVQPLFYLADARRLVFASRLQGVSRCAESGSLSVDPAALPELIASYAIPTPGTIFQEVKKLPAGSSLLWKDGAASIRAHWDLDFLHPSREPVGALEERTRGLFRECIELRLEESPDPARAGAFLSGGIDSSTVLGVMTQARGGPVKSFSIGFSEERFNEMEYARIAARAFGSEHHEYFVTPRDTERLVPLIIDAFDEPFGNSSAVPTYYCAELARSQGVETLFAGDGGDELWGGNERYATQAIFEYWRRVPAWLRAGVVKPAVLALAAALPMKLFRKGRGYIQKAEQPFAERLTAYGFFRTVPRETLFTPETDRAIGGGYGPAQTVRRWLEAAPAREGLDRELYLDLKLAVSDNDLLKVTRMCETAGVTVHFPFLDRSFAEFAATVPAAVKMEGRQLRSFFKRTYAGLLPRETIQKTKHGFGLPIPVWLRSDPALSEMMRELVLSTRTIARGYFRKEALEDLVAKHRSDRTSFYGTALWNLMVLELWLRTHLDGRKG